MGTDDDIIRNGSVNDWLFYYLVKIGNRRVRAFWLALALLAVGFIVGKVA